MLLCLFFKKDSLKSLVEHLRWSFFAKIVRLFSYKAPSWVLYWVLSTPLIRHVFYDSYLFAFFTHFIAQIQAISLGISEGPYQKTITEAANTT